ncbi:MAG: LemA family protein [Patescibacteria group bacterium]|jgi:LemA protein
MKKKNIIWGLVALVILVVIGLWSSYNKLVVAEEGVNTQWAQVEAQYQRRADLIMNLMASVEGQFDQEQAVFGELARARQNYSGAQTMGDKIQAATEMDGALGRLLVIMENYPELKSSELMAQFMAQQEGTENRISVERQRFNEAAQNYNILTRRIPTNIIASLFNFSAKPYFQSSPGAEQAPQIDFRR